MFDCNSLWQRQTVENPHRQMPALANPRWEAFAQALFIGLSGKTRQERANSTAYLTAYPGSTAPGSAKASAARLLARVSPILERVRELQAEQAKRTQKKIDISRDRLARRLDIASTLAEQQGNVAGIVSSELGIAKIFGLESTKENTPQSFRDAKSMEEIGKRLLISVGLREPADDAVALAIEANNAFVARLEQIAAEMAGRKRGR
jgi:hypothetical protein